MPESLAPGALAESPQEAAARRPRRGLRRAGGLAVAGLAVLAAGAAGCSSSASTASTAAAPAASHVGVPTAIQFPAQIASMKKYSDQPEADASSGLPVSVRKNLHSVYYRDNTDGSLTVNVAGGMGLPIPTDGPADKVKAMFTEWDMSAAGHDTITVAAAPVGGIAECVPPAPDSPKDVTCGWVNGKAALTMDFTGFGLTRARALVPQILTAMVQS